MTLRLCARFACVWIAATWACSAWGAQLPPALFLRVVQSSDASANNGASRALDGANSTFSLTADKPESYWSAELGRPYPLERIELVNRPAPNDQELDGLTLRLFNLDDQVVFEAQLSNPGPGGTLVIDLPAGLRARSVWIGLPEGRKNGGSNDRVGLAELRLWGDLSLPYGPPPVETTTATVKVAQSSNYSSAYPAANALDGDPATFTHTADRTNSYWVADWNTAYRIDRVELVNRESCCSQRLAGLVLHILDGSSNTVATTTLTNPGLGGTWTYNPPSGTLGRYLWVGLENNQQNADGNYYVTLAEARVFSGSTNLLATARSPVGIVTNLASGKPAYMVRLTSSVPPATNANDDNYATETKTTTQSVDAYWEVDLGTTYALYSMRTIAASGIGNRLTNTTIRLFDNARKSVHFQRLSGKPDVFDSDLNGPVFARYARLGLENKRRTDPAGGLEWYIGMREVEVFGRPTNEVGLRSFSASTNQIALGQPVTLSWTVEDVRRLELYPELGSVGAHTEPSGLGSITLTPTRSTEYILIASNAAGLFTRAVSVQVNTNPLPVRISEIVAENRYSLRDGYNESPDWIELRNTGNTAVDLAGYSLSDDAKQPRQWIFPSINIDPHGTLIVFASGRATVDSAGRPHTNFRLEKQGGTVVLTAPDGLTTVDALIPYPSLDADLAYGRNLQGQWSFLEPTPNALNTAITYEGWLQPLTFSHERGFYEAPFTLSITNGNPGASVFYSLDGSVPSLSYTGGIRLAMTKSVRAQAVKPGFKPPRIQTQTYLFLNSVITSSVIRTTISKDPRYAPRLKPGLLSLPSISLVVPGQPEYQEKEGSVEILWPDGAPPAQANCGVSRFGGSWQEFAKKSFRVKFRTSYGVTKLQAPLFNGFDRGVLARTSFDEIEFRSGSQDMIDRGFYMASRFVEDSMLDMGSLNPHGRFVHVYLNGVYWGQYDAREPLVDHFLADYLGGSHEQYVNVRGNDNVGENFTPGTPDPPHVQAWERVVSLKNSYRAVRPYLDVSHLIDFMLLWFYGNCESEYRAAGPIDAGTGFKFWMADADGFLRTSALGSNRSSNPGPGGLFGGLVAEGNSDFKILLADRIYQHCFNDGALTPARNNARLTARMEEIRDSLVVECARWNYRTPANWESAAATIRSQLFPTRTSQLVSQLRSRGLYPSFAPPQFNQYGGLVTNGFQPQLSSADGTIYYTLDGSDPRLPSGTIFFKALVWKPGAVSITQDLTLQARVRTSNGQWSALAQPRFLVATRRAPTAQDLLVTEIHYHPVDFEDYEFVELWNASTNLLDLSGVSLSNAVRFLFPNGYTLAPGTFTVVVKNTAAFAQRYQNLASPWYWPDIPVAGEWVGNLDNQAETLSIISSNGVELMTIPYRSNGNWPERADGHGSSLELRPLSTGMDFEPNWLAYLADGNNWSSSALYHGSPGRRDSFVKSVRINEILPAADGIEGWVEILNTDSQPVDLTDYVLANALDQLPGWAFPADTVLPPGQFLVRSNSQTGLRLGHEGGNLLLLQRSGANVIRFLDTVDYTATLPGESVGIYERSDGALNFTELSFSTPGHSNAPPRIGPVVISEIHFVPADGKAEFIELANITGSPVSLFNPSQPTQTWKIEGIGNFSFPTGAVLPPFSSLLVCSTNPADFRLQYGLDTSVPVLGPWSGVLDDDGETLTLLQPGELKPDGTVPYYRVDHVSYQVEPPWPQVSPDRSLEKVSLTTYGNDPIHWKTGPIGGTPGLTPVIRPTEPLILTFLPNANTLHFTFPCVAGALYRLEYSDTLSPPHWDLYQELTGPPANLIEIVIPDTRAAPQRFYRVRWLK